jgi:SPARC-related modular calcium-binding protein
MLKKKYIKKNKPLIRNLRRCGKRLPRFCDVNNDKKITLSEWLNCLQTQRVQGEKVQLPLHHEPIFPAQTKLKGKKNPLESYLKAD